MKRRLLVHGIVILVAIGMGVEFPAPVLGTPIISSAEPAAAVRHQDMRCQYLPDPSGDGTVWYHCR